jgi:hypothetical protein
MVQASHQAILDRIAVILEGFVRTYEFEATNYEEGLEALRRTSGPLGSPT